MEEPLEKRLLAYLSRPGYEPQDRSAIARGMGVHTAERAELRALLSRWESERRLLRLRGARLALATTAHSSYTGTVRALPRGKRLFVPYAEGQAALEPLVAHAQPVEVVIAPGRSMGAMDGDVVRATVVRDTPPAFRRRKKGLRPESAAGLRLTARVEEVLQRRHEMWVGTYCMQGRRAFLRGDGRSSPKSISPVGPAPADLLVGMLALVQPVSAPTDAGEARGRIVEVLGWPEEPGVDMAALICRYALRTRFPEEVLSETQLLPSAPQPADMADREDWTTRCVVTVDPTTARDFDDAVSLRRTAAGWELAVHIADVSHYVRPGSALDAEARRRGNSTYLPDRVLPMLPPRLCDELCSLVQGEPRLTLLCHMRISPEGVVQQARLARAVICSRMRLDYAAVLALLEQGQSTGDAEVDTMLRESARLAELLRCRRMEQGALNLDMPELRAVLDDRGRVSGFVREESDPSHQLIEEFMLAANEQVARLLRERELPALYRVHEEPAPDKWADLAHTLREYGISASTLPGRKELVRVMAQVEKHPDAPRLKVLVLRAMMRARYAPRALGHFGLAKADYCHFTSPIRRYADLVVHRCVAHLLGQGGRLPAAGGLEQLAEHLSDAERQSAAAEAEAMRLKLLQYLEQQVESGSPQRRQAIVTGVWAHGVAIELEELLLRGYVPAAALPRRRGWYYAGHEWRGPEGRRLQEGARLWVLPVAVDWETQSVDFRPAEEE